MGWGEPGVRRLAGRRLEHKRDGREVFVYDYSHGGTIAWRPGASRGKDTKIPVDRFLDKNCKLT